MSQTFTGDENSNDQVAEFLRILGTELRDGLACTVSIVHHTGKAGDSLRGASAMFNNTDFVLSVERDGKEMLATLDFPKTKDSERPEPQTFELSVQQLGQGRRRRRDHLPGRAPHQQRRATGRGAQARRRRRPGRAKHAAGEPGARRHAGARAAQSLLRSHPRSRSGSPQEGLLPRSRLGCEGNGYFEIAGDDRRVIVLKKEAV
jgi:hypothetical protein